MCPEAMEMALLSRYVRARLSNDRDFDPAGFTQLYATLAAQRATKILGIFARLDRRDGKPQYLRHMPRLWNYLQRSLAHPALAALQGLVRRKCAGSGWVMILRFGRRRWAGRSDDAEKRDGAGCRPRYAHAAV